MGSDLPNVHAAATQPGYGSVQPPLPVGGGSDDEKFHISPIGGCTDAPGLVTIDYIRRLFIVSIVMLGVGVACCIGVGVCVASGVPILSLLFGIIGGFSVFLGITIVLLTLRIRSAHHRNRPHITKDSIAEFLIQVGSIGGTLPQMTVVASLLGQANPDAAHEVQVTKMGKSWGRVVYFQANAKFGMQNLPPGQRPQLHLYRLE